MCAHALQRESLTLCCCAAKGQAVSDQSVAPVLLLPTAGKRTMGSAALALIKQWCALANHAAQSPLSRSVPALLASSLRSAKDYRHAKQHCSLTKHAAQQALSLEMCLHCLQAAYSTSCAWLTGEQQSSVCVIKRGSVTVWRAACVSALTAFAKR